MKSNIFEGIAERLAEIKREEAEARGYRVWGVDFGVEHKPITPRHIIEKLANPPVIAADPVSHCSVYGHDIGLSGVCIWCGLKP